MYLEHFALTDSPFSIAPNPDYLYMSPRHKEALAHLHYGLRESGGFVLLTGEVGTGKTTVSRKLMAELPATTQLAMIINPTLSAHELLATVCDELGIDTPGPSTSLKGLTDAILHHLMANHEAGINTVLMIDEAQHLQPDVLEQLRLLTNLETHREKLLKVVLIGQPELQVLLKRHELRQLSQRITARYHLLPLGRKETAAYVAHRLGVSGCHQSLFSHGALALLARLSGGIPRLINLICDRALSLCYGQQKARISRYQVLLGATQVLGDEVVRVRMQGARRVYMGLVFITGVVLGVTLGGWYA